MRQSTIIGRQHLQTDGEIKMLHVSVQSNGNTVKQISLYHFLSEPTSMNNKFNVIVRIS